MKQVQINLIIYMNQQILNFIGLLHSLFKSINWSEFYILDLKWACHSY